MSRWLAPLAQVLGDRRRLRVFFRDDDAGREDRRLTFATRHDAQPGSAPLRSA